MKNMTAPKLQNARNSFLFPDDSKVSLSEYKENIACAEMSGDMTFSEFQNRIDRWMQKL